MRSIPVTMLVAAALLSARCASARAQVERVWLTHRTNDPGKLVVNWTTKNPGDSVVRFGTTPRYGQEVGVAGNDTLHHVEIPLDEKDVVYHYSVRTGEQTSPDATFKGYPTDVLRVAVVANWQGKPDLSAIVADDVHLLLTAGDNVANLHGACGEGVKDCIAPYAALVDRYPELFRSTPFLPVLGNHDREIRPRGPEPPEEAVYDVEATAFRRFFELPDDEWKWRFDVPDLDVRFVALDLNHISDMGTTWQTCHAFEEGSEQFEWYRKLMDGPSPSLVVTLHNERNGSMRSRAGGEWHRMFRRGTLAITGFGHFAERAVVDGFPYYNTSLAGKGDRYPDPRSKFLAGENGYVLLTISKDPRTMTVEMKKLDGAVMDRQVYEPR